MGSRNNSSQPSDAEGGIPWHRYLAAVLRYKWLVLGVTIAGSAAGVFGTRLLPRVYVTQATVWVASSPAPGGPVRAQEVLDQRGMVDLVKSFAILDSVVNQEHLYLNSNLPSAMVGFGTARQYVPGYYRMEISEDGKRYTLKEGEDALIEQGHVGDSVGRSVGMLWQPDPAKVRGKTITFGLLSPRGAAVALQQRLVVTLPEQSSFMRLSLSDANADRVTRTLNSVIDRFVELATDLKDYKLRETTRILEQQLTTVGNSLRNAEERLENYKTEIITLPSEAAPVAAGLQMTQPTVITKYFDEKIEFERLQREREALRGVLADAAQNRLNLATLPTMEAVRSSSQLNDAIKDLSGAETNLRALQQHYTDSATPVIEEKQRIELLRTSVLPTQLRAVLAAMDGRVTELQSHLASASRELQRIPTRVITEQRLERERLSLTAIYTDLQSRYQSAKLAEATAIPGVKVLDRAVQPQWPTKNNARRMMVMAFMASLGAGLGLGILLDRLDKRVRYPEQVSDSLGLSILGAIPAIKPTQGGAVPPDQAAQFIEAFRTVRVNLAHSFNTNGAINLTISSPSAGDGKSLVSSNLAVSFATAGYNTVLVDGDIRRGELHRMFGTDRRPGLLDFLQGEATLDEIIRPSDQDRLWVIPCGSRRQHGPELLGSAAMQNLLADLGQRFNAVLIDSPPLAAGVDPFVLGSATGNLVMVIRSGETDRHLAEAKLSIMDRMPIRILGAVLNDVQTNNGAYRYYSYLYGYEAEEERSAQLPKGG